jgi:hypothetical protein
MVTVVAAWRCDCGIRIKVIGEIEAHHALASSIAECPRCGDQQLVYASQIVSVSEDVDETNHWLH